MSDDTSRSLQQYKVNGTLHFATSELGQTEILLRRNKLPMIYPHYSYTIER